MNSEILIRDKYIHNNEICDNANMSKLKFDFLFLKARRMFLQK